MKKVTGQLNPDFVALLEMTHKHLLDIQYGCHAFNPAGLSSSGAQNVTKVVRYDTPDTLGTVEGAGYFNSYALTFEAGDTLQVVSTASPDGGFRAYQVTATTGGTLTLARQEAPRMALQYFINETDLAAGTPQYLRAYAPGRVVDHLAVVQTTIVSGGTLTIAQTTAGITGGVITVSGGALAGTALNGTAVPKTGNPGAVVTTGGVLVVTPSASFSGGGAISGEILIEPIT
jgi:hypothetical protein